MPEPDLSVELLVAIFEPLAIGVETEEPRPQGSGQIVRPTTTRKLSPWTTIVNTTTA